MYLCVCGPRPRTADERERAHCVDVIRFGHHVSPHRRTSCEGIWTDPSNTNTASTTTTTQQRAAVLAMIERGDWQALYALDELQRELQEGNLLNGFATPAPEFAPTFKVGLLVCLHVWSLFVESSSDLSLVFLLLSSSFGFFLLRIAKVMSLSQFNPIQSHSGPAAPPRQDRVQCQAYALLLRPRPLQVAPRCGLSFRVNQDCMHHVPPQKRSNYSRRLTRTSRR